MLFLVFAFLTIPSRDAVLVLLSPGDAFCVYGTYSYCLMSRFVVHFFSYNLLGSILHSVKYIPSPCPPLYPYTLPTIVLELSAS